MNGWVLRMDLVLRPLLDSDAPLLAAWAIDPIFCAHAGWRERSTPDEAIPWWRAAIELPDPALMRFIAISNDEPVGYVDLHGDAADERELGFVIGPSARWGQGLGTAAARAGLAYGFTVLGLSRIWAEAVEANSSSVRILRRIGMQDAGAGDVETFLGVTSRYARFDLSRAGWFARRPC